MQSALRIASIHFHELLDVWTFLDSFQTFPEPPVLCPAHRLLKGARSSEHLQQIQWSSAWSGIFLSFSRPLEHGFHESIATIFEPQLETARLRTWPQIVYVPELSNAQPLHNDF